MKNLVRIKKLFFDRPKVSRYFDRKTLYALNWFGGNVRKTAQRSMRSRKGSQKSGQGKAPFAHGQKLLRKLLFYSMEERKKTVVVGPILLDKTADLGVPRLMEQGGRVAGTYKGKPIVKDYKGNPYMIPAFNIHIGKVASMYRNKV